MIIYNKTKILQNTLKMGRPRGSQSQHQKWMNESVMDEHSLLFWMDALRRMMFGAGFMKQAATLGGRSQARGRISMDSATCYCCCSRLGIDHVRFRSSRGAVILVKL